MAIAAACRSRRPSIYCSEDEEEIIMNIIVDNNTTVAAKKSSENTTTTHHHQRRSSPSQHSQSMILPPKVSLIDNTLALGFSLKRARGEMGEQTMVLKKSNSDSVIHTKRRKKVDPTYNHNHVVINSTNHLTSSSSFSKVDNGNTTDPEENLCPYSFIDSLLQSSRRNSMSSSSSPPLCKEDTTTPKPPLDDNDFHPPTPEQIEAYSNDAVNAVRSSDIDCLRTLLSNGQSLQCCNRFGESLLHVACRRSNAEIVSFLLHEAKVSPCIRDDYGRTPLHDACWRGNPEYEIVELLLSVEPRLAYVKDVRGHRPFQYARREHWPNWREFIDRKRELILLPRSNSDGVLRERTCSSPI